MEKSSLGRVCFVPIHPVSDCLFAVHENVMSYVTCDVMWCHLVSDNEIASDITWQGHHMTLQVTSHDITSDITWHWKWCHMTLQVMSHNITSDITWHWSDITWHWSDLTWHYKWHHMTLQVTSHDITSGITWQVTSHDIQVTWNHDLKTWLALEGCSGGSGSAEKTENVQLTFCACQEKIDRPCCKSNCKTPHEEVLGTRHHVRPSLNRFWVWDTMLDLVWRGSGYETPCWT